MDDWTKPNDPLYPQQWHLHLLKMEEAWKIEKGSPNVIVAVIERGFQLDHPDLKDQWAGHINLIGDDDLMESPDISVTDHGTHMCGIIAAEGNNHEGGIGVAPRCKLLPIKCNSYDDIQLASAIRLAVDQGARVINLSDAGYHYAIKAGLSGKRGGWTIPPNDNLRKACLYAAENGALIVTSTGGNGRMHDAKYPALYPECMITSAVNDRGESSNFNDYGRLAEIATPGGERIYPSGLDLVGVLSCCHTKNGGYKQLSGNCQAVAIASGIAALLYSHFPGIQPDQVRQILRNTTHRVPWNPYTGHGLVDPVKALSVSSIEHALRIHSEDITVSGKYPMRVRVTIHNDGVLDAHRVPVLLYKGKPETESGIQLAFGLVDIRGLGEATIELEPWEFSGVSELWVAIDPCGQLSRKQAEQGVYHLLSCRKV